MATFKRIKGEFNIKTKADFNVLTRKLPILLANQIERHFELGFRQGGGQTDESRGGWKPRKAADKGRGILIKSGTLRKDVRQREARFASIRVGTSGITQRYADVHNSGLRSGRGKGFTMPQREFIGKSKDLEKKNEKIIARELKRMLI